MNPEPKGTTMGAIGLEELPRCSWQHQTSVRMSACSVWRESRSRPDVASRSVRWTWHPSYRRQTRALHAQHVLRKHLPEASFSEQMLLCWIRALLGALGLSWEGPHVPLCPSVPARPLPLLRHCRWQSSASSLRPKLKQQQQRKNPFLNHSARSGVIFENILLHSLNRYLRCYGCAIDVL